MFKIRRSSDNKDKTVEIDLLSLVSVALIVLMGVFLIFGIFGFVKQYLKISKFEVSGLTVYETAELAGAAGIRKGDRLYLINTDKAEEQILSKCTYLESVRVKRIFPNKIRFEVESREPMWYLEISGDYYILDSNFRVLEETKNAEKINGSSIAKLTLPSPNNVIVGQTITFGETEAQTEKTKEIMRTLLLSRIYPRLSKIDIENRFDIYLEVDGMFSVTLGGYENLDVKLQTLYRLLEETDTAGAVGGEISIISSGESGAIRLNYGNT